MDTQNPNPDPVKLEIIESSSEIMAPKPMEGLHDQAPPPFLTKTYDVVDDASTDQIVSWSQTNNSFVVWDPHAFSMTLLPKYFKHNNFSSFVRQLNTYIKNRMRNSIIKFLCAKCFKPFSSSHDSQTVDSVVSLFYRDLHHFESTDQGFRKVDPDKWEFANEGFLRGQKHLLKTIKRRRPPSHLQPQPPPHPQPPPPFVEVGQYGFDAEIDRLKRDKHTLMTELVKLRQEQQNTRAHLKAMEQRLQGTEHRQQQMMVFLARAMRNPNFLQQLVQQREKRKELEEALSKKRQRPIDQFAHSDIGTSNHHHQQQQYFYAAPELEDLAMVMQGFRNDDELNEQQEEVDVELNDEFWQELLHDGICEEKGKAELDEGGLQEEGLMVERNSCNSGSR